MKWIYILIVCLVVSSVFALSPQTVAITSVWDEAEGYVSTNEFYRGHTLLLTSCVAYAGSTTGAARQSLTDITTTLSIGFVSSNISWTVLNQVATNGLWWISLTVPTNWTEPYLQLKLTDTATNIFIYPLKKLKTKGALE